MRQIGLAITTLLLTCALFSNCLAQESFEDPEKAFKTPGESARPGVLWMWMGANVSKEGITKDLEALKNQGFNRTTMFSLADITTPWAVGILKNPTPEVISWTEPWWKLVRHAAEESKRLGMDFGTFNGAGYESSGGKWVSPELSMQEICWSEIRVSGNKRIKIALPKPRVPARGKTPYPVFNPGTGKIEIPEIEARSTYYKDIAVVAMPATGIVSKKQIIELTDKMLADGQLSYELPEGNWIIYRFGHTTTGTLIQPAQWEAAGLECDKMSQQAVEFHIDHIISEIKNHLGDLVGTGFTHVHFDSYEAGVPTWTPKMRQEFLSRRGYDLLPYLASFAKRTIGSSQDSARFAADFDATVKDLYRDVYFKTLASKLKAANLTFLAEPYGGPWRQDDIMPLVANVMTEFWTDNGRFSPYELEPTVASLRKSGQNIVEAEAFTGGANDSRWSETPAWLKSIGDAAFCAGVNRMVIHRFVHQPWDDRYLPGATMGQWGTHFDRTQTWWKPAKAMVDYWQRCQSLLQWGHINSPDNDFKAVTVRSGAEIKHIHRRAKTEDIYFVANINRSAGSANCSFKISGRQPELWDPVSGEMRDLPKFTENDGYTTVPLDFEDSQSFFIVFRKKVSETQVADENFPKFTISKVLEGNWQVKFDPKWGGPQKPVIFNTLVDWTENADPGIKYYSGTAVYTQSFDVPGNTLMQDTYLDLGMVNHIATVRLNGRDIGTVWTSPWRIKIPAELLKARNNNLEISVTNVWANRLIGDEQQPEDMEWLQADDGAGRYLKEFPDWFLNRTPRPSNGRYCFTTWNYFKKDSPLISSGLLGPVNIINLHDYQFPPK